MLLEKTLETLLTALCATERRDGGCASYIFGTRPTVNVDLPSNPNDYPVAIAFVVSSYQMDTRTQRRREHAQCIVQILDRQTDISTDRDYRQQADRVDLSTGLFLRFLRDGEQWGRLIVRNDEHPDGFSMDVTPYKVRETVIETRRVIGGYDSNLQGVSLTFTLEERQGTCLDDYGYSEPPTPPTPPTPQETEPDVD